MTEKFNVTPKGSKVAKPLFLTLDQIKFLAKNWPDPPPPTICSDEEAEAYRKSQENQKENP